MTLGVGWLISCSWCVGLPGGGVLRHLAGWQERAWDRARVEERSDGDVELPGRLAQRWDQNAGFLVDDPVEPVGSVAHGLGDGVSPHLEGDPEVQGQDRVNR